MAERIGPAPEETRSKRERLVTMTLRREAEIVDLFRIIKTSIFLNVLMVRIELNIAHEKNKILREFLASNKPKYLIFAVNNHSSDIDALTVHKLLNEKYPELHGKIMMLVDHDRWIQPKSRSELEANIGSYIMFDKKSKSASHLADVLAAIKEAMDQGFVLVFFTEGTREEGAKQGDFAASVASHIENGLEPGSFTEGVLTVEMSLNGLRGVLPKVELEEEKNQKLNAIKRRAKHLVNPAEWHRPDAWRKASLSVEQFYFSRSKSGQKLTRGEIKKMFKEARANRQSTAEPQTPTEAQD